MLSTQVNVIRQPCYAGLSLLTTTQGPFLHMEGCQHVGAGHVREPTTTERVTRSLCRRCQKELRGEGRRRFGVDLEGAMRFFGTHVTAQSAVRATLARIDYDLLWVPPSKAYIAVGSHRQAAAWVHHGHIGIPGGPRVELPGYGNRTRSGAAALGRRRGAKCPTCHLEMPLAGLCADCSD